MKPFYHTGRFLANDPDGAPFGLSWLRGITPERFGLVELICIVFSVRQAANELLDHSWLDVASDVILGAHIYLAASLPMLVLVTVADRRTCASTNKHRIVALSTAVSVGAVGYAAGVAIAFGLDGWHFPDKSPVWIVFPLLGYFLRALLIGGLLTSVLYFITRETAIKTSLRTARLTRIELDRQMAEARLRVLQAQIEPHFLFNTLAHIKRLYLVDATSGRAILLNLIEYLRAALPQMRDSRSTVGRELAQVRAYLNVLQGRMGERLEVHIVAPDDLNDAELPPMMLSTLVENAIKHGISPLAQGGAVKIVVTRDGARLKISVADNGVGFKGISGGGVGLANTRARLAALYGARGHLAVEANPIRGVTVSIGLPFSIQATQEMTA